MMIDVPKHMFPWDLYVPKHMGSDLLRSRHWHDGGEFFIDVCVGIQDCF